MNATNHLRRPDVSLADKYEAATGPVFLSGTQALVRLPIEQRRRDQAAGLKTGAYISGYRGSPLGRYDMELWAADAVLKRYNIVFRAAVNEDLAATAIWGAQHVGAFPGATVDGVFGIWYGKGPGVDRSADVFRHANSAGSSATGGVLALAGDDHGAKSSTIANFSDQVMIAAGMPLLYPSNTQELLDFGLHGIAMSRFSGCWVGMKVVTDVVEGGGTIEVGSAALPVIPDLPSLPAATPLGGPDLNIRRFDMPLAAEDRLYNHKLYAALAYARANRINALTREAPQARLAIVAAGKAYQDVLQAFDLLDWNDAMLAKLGVRLAKVGMTWPMDPEFVRTLAHGVGTVFVVEEKRPLLEDQLKSILYDLELTNRPGVVGKAVCSPTYTLERGTSLLSNSGELSPAIVAAALLKVMRMVDPSAAVADCPAAAAAVAPLAGQPQRNASFCSGCPHNRSTRVIDGSRALAGIGCHTIAMLNAPSTTGTVSHMGGEGIMWLGQAPFTTEPHVFANMGDGTYFHSGFLAVRQAIAAKVTITYKLLVNGFVSMTGGQPVDGELSVPQMIRQLQAEGAAAIMLVSDEPQKYADAQLPAGVAVHHRERLDAVQQQLRQMSGVTVLLYEQPCATERRRLRKRGKWPDPAKRAFVNAAVCEGCGDCGAVSNCLSIEPLETPFGRKRIINQSSCNKDLSCVDGFCPSFVTVHGGSLRKPALANQAPAWPALPEPALAPLLAPVRILVGGIGGTGVVTIGQVLGMAAHLDGLACSILDVTGLAQKYGAVLSHVQIASKQQQLHATRIAPGQADTVVACDLIVANGAEALACMASQRTRLALCTDVIPTSEFSRNPDWNVDAVALVERVRSRSAIDGFEVDGVALAKALMGDSVAANMFMLGAAWQRGWIPLSAAALHRAIELNGVQVAFNQAAFLWGRRAACDLAAVRRAAAPASVVQLLLPDRETLADIIERSERYLTSYQNTAYARRYRVLVERVVEADLRLGGGGRLARTAARSYFKLLAIKDEWEVARLHASDAFHAQLAATFEGDFKLHFHLGVWPFARTDPATGKLRKAELGPWVGGVFRLMAAARGLRGGWLDPFRFSDERRLGLRLLAEFERDVDTVLALPARLSVEQGMALLALPQKIRGYGHVRQAAAARAALERERLLAATLS